MRCWTEIDLSAVRHNADVASERTGCGVMAIVKANAYGLGAVQVAKALSSRVKMFGVATVAEGAQLREAGIRKPVLVLGCCTPQERAEVVALGLTATISSIAEAEAWEKEALRQKKRGFAVHAVIDTGMGRIGFQRRDWTVETIASLKALRGLKIEGLATHFPSADEDKEFTKGQIRKFGELVQFAAAHGLKFKYQHVANSAGVLGYPGLNEVSNLVRPGLMLYGASPLPKLQPLLKPALTWKAHVTLVRTVPKGTCISYGRTVLTRRLPTRVATLSVGYADGYPRHLSGQGAEVLIQGQRCSVLGRVTMDQIMVDVTKLPEVTPGEEAVLLGTQGAGEITAAELAKKAGTIPWEILTGISARVERRWNVT